MSNIQSAKKALKAELDHAKKGMSYYVSMVDKLEQTLAQLDQIGDTTGKEVTTTPRQKSKTRQMGKVALKTRPRPAPGKRLPDTRGEYWLNFITVEPKSIQEILDEAVGNLNFSPTQEELKKLKQSLAYTMNYHVGQSKKIQDSGARKNRRFFKPRH